MKVEHNGIYTWGMNFLAADRILLSV